MAENWQQFLYWDGYDPPDASKFFFEPQHVWWQIRWNYTSTNNESYYLGFSIYVYKETMDAYFHYDDFSTDGRTEGRYRFTETGRFMIICHIGNVSYLEIWGEQDVDSIPEFPSFLILPLFFVTTLLAVIVYRKKHAKISESP